MTSFLYFWPLCLVTQLYFKDVYFRHKVIDSPPPSLYFKGLTKFMLWLFNNAIVLTETTYEVILVDSECSFDFSTLQYKNQRWWQLTMKQHCCKILYFKQKQVNFKLMSLERQFKFQ